MGLALASAVIPGLFTTPVSTGKQSSRMAKLAKLDKGSNVGLAGGDNVAFPSDLESQQFYMTFECVKRRQKGRTTAITESSLGAVHLPMPAGLQTSHSAKYSAEALGALGMMGAGAADTLAQFADDPSMSGAGQMLEAASTAAKRNIGTIALQGATSPAVSGAAGGSVGGIAGAGIGVGATQFVKGGMYGLGMAFNPHLAQLFQGVDFRSHNFSFKMVAKNKDEANDIRKIVAFFRKKMLPEYRSLHNGNKAANQFNYPDEWIITFSKPEFLFNLKRSVLVKFDINYHAEGKAFYHVAGEPVSVQINLTFNETEILTADDPTLNQPVPRQTPDDRGSVDVDAGPERNPIKEGAAAQKAAIDRSNAAKAAKSIGDVPF